MAELRILIADEHAVLRAGLQVLIDAQPDMRVVGQAATGREAIRQAAQLQPDLLVMSVSLPEVSGADATEQIKRAFPCIHIVVLTRHRSQGYLQRLLRAGASAYVLKQTPVTELLSALRSVAAGGTYLDPQLEGTPGKHAADRSPSTRTPIPLARLTVREMEVLHAIAWGRSNKEIAHQFGISVKTVEYHKSSAVDKLKLRSRTDIVRFALASGWLREDMAPD